MAQIFGGAGAHAASQSVAVFKKIFLTVTGVIALLALLEGFVSAALLTTGGKSLPLTLFAGAFAAGAIWIGRFYSRRLDKYESERMSWRMGAIGECEVAAELERLPDNFTVFNNVNTKRGNLDHVVVGPTGLFALETKNWKGLITATAEGELTRNGRASTVPHVRKFLARAMMVREQVISLTHRDDFRVRAVMVFPKAHVEAPYGTTRKVHCVRLNQLRDYIENTKFSAKLDAEQVDRLVRALHGIAGMDVDFAETTTAAIEAA
ncbi:MAG: nuclease-related domain-containing protein [Chthoniobacterales bacterium]